MKAFLWILLFCGTLLSEETLYLKGYLSKEELLKGRTQVEKWEAHPPKELRLVVQGNSGDLMGALNLANTLSQLKQRSGVKLTVYIEDQALGPAAIFPFLADRIEGSDFFAWGDIPSGADTGLPTNFLQNRLLGLIDPHAKQLPLLRLLAQAMTDPQVKVIDDHGWKLATSDKDLHASQISVPGETLVVNQNQMKELGLLEKSTLAPPVQLPEIPTSSLEEMLKAHIHPLDKGPNRVGKITIDDRTSGINQSTWIYVKNALDYYKKNPPLFLILELNTPGGEVFAAQKISDALKELDTQYNIPVVAYINNWAISAGAMLAYSCRFISVVKDGSMGAAEPVLQDQSTGEMKTASEKVNSALRADFANRASFFGRNPFIAEAMVDKDMILVLRHGKVIKLDAENQIRTVGPDPDVVISPKGKLLTLNAEQLIAYGVADIALAPVKMEVITEAEKEKGEWPGKKEALFQYPFFAAIPEAQIDPYRMDWKTLFFSWLANPLVSSALFLGMMLGFYLEINTPGALLPGLLAAFCLTLLVLSSFSLEIGDYFELILLLAGLALLGVDLLLFPTFGLLGGLGALLFLGGFFALLLPGMGSIQFEVDTRTFNAAGEAFLNRLGWLIGTFLVGIFAMMLLARYVAPNLSGFKKFVLEGDEQVGYTAGISPEKLPPAGTKGLATTPLRPAGKIEADGHLFDAMSTGRFIEKGAQVVIVRLDGSTIIVEEVNT